MNYGFQNEIDFVNYFNEKYFNEIDNKGQEFLTELFDMELDNHEKIIAWKNKIHQKTDIYIKYKNYTKGVSLKCGHDNSVHNENVENFRYYLERLRIPYKLIEYYISYHYGYGTDKFGNKDFKKRLTSEEYKLIHQNELDKFNKYLNKTKLIVDLIDRFIIKGTNSEYEIDALISGTVDDYVWILKYDIYDLILFKRNIPYTSPHIGCLTIGPKTRNINGECKNKKDRYRVCVKWSNIKEDIINYKKNNFIN